MRSINLRASARPASLLSILLAVTITAVAQSPAPASLATLNDPANLAGQRVSAPALADNLPVDHSTLALQQLLRKLRSRASFMLIVAHPDDEDGGMLTYLSRGQGARVATLTLTRGEGGQNLMSADFDDALGLIRTQELLAADRYFGATQFFGTEVDFGFSKTKEESFAKWTHDRVLYDAVRAVRLYRPLVIGAVFIGAPSDGHGQHQVSGEIAQEVFNAAGNPKVFPDQIAAGLLPWKPLKVYARVPFARIDSEGMYDYATNQYVTPLFTNYVTGKVTNTVPTANVIVPEGDTDPLLGGLSYVQFAREGLALQKTQIGKNARLASPGPHNVSYHRYGSRVGQADGDESGLESGFFQGIDTSLAGIATLAPDASNKIRPFLEKLDQEFSEAQRLFDPGHPELTAPPLRTALAGLDSLIRELNNPSVDNLPAEEKYNLLHELNIKRVQCNDALVLAEGVTLQATLAYPAPGRPLLTTDHHIVVHATLINHGTDTLTLAGVAVHTPDNHPTPFPNDSVNLPLVPGASHTDEVTVDTPGLPATRPYFTRPDIEQPFYNISNSSLRNAPATPTPLTALVTLEDHGVPLQLAANVQSSTSPAAPGSAPFIPVQAAVVVPPVSIAVSPSAGIVPLQQASFPVTASVQAEDHIPTPADVTLSLPDGKTIARTSQPATTAPGAETATFSVPTADIPTHPITLTAAASRADQEYREGFRPAGYPGLTYTNFYSPATYRATAVDVHIAPHLNIAYLPGTGDSVPAALEDLGIHVHLLTVADLTPQTLKPFDVLILGVRSYGAHPNLAAANPILNAYAAAGGVVIDQYDTGRLPEGTGPYPLSLGDSEKVVDETAPIRILAPSNPLLTWPNHITSADFNGWFEERGHGFMGTWDPHYIALTETHDPGQKPQLGGLLVARTGKGAWIYLGYAIYRQLPEGVPGAFRIMANLLSAAKNPALHALPTAAH